MIASSLKAVGIPISTSTDADLKKGVDMFGALFMSDLDKRWPSKRIPYVIDLTVKNESANLVGAVRASADYINRRTFVRLTEIQETDVEKEPGYVRVVLYSLIDQGMSFPCAAKQMGYHAAPPEHIIWVGGPGKSLKFCNQYDAASIVHEFLHAVGLRHEMGHKLRDAYIKIDEENLDKDGKYQFWAKADQKNEIREAETAGLPYDFTSIMHYPISALAKDPSKPSFVIVEPDGKIALDAIKAKEPAFQIGQHNCMSETDAGAVNLLYASAP
ncbi:hypothetical protein X743_32135 [Mesorhizobium sp. LNHC252B00]|nr:hypothetical protein X743_32135 [Mesorhizobium sp. LNHC252B00]